VNEPWMTIAGHKAAETDGGPMHGGAPRAVWQSLGIDPHRVSARSAAQRLDQLGRASHLVWNPLTGEIIQLIPVLRAACSLGTPEGLGHLVPPDPRQAGTPARPRDHELAARAADGVAAVNAEGRLCVQICVVAFAWEPFTDGPMNGLKAIISWLDSWGIPRQWPAGRPDPFPHGYTSCRSRRLWAKGGHFGASQVPGCATAGPGCIDVEMVTGRASAHGVELPRARAGGMPCPTVTLPDLAGIFGTEAPVAATLSGVS
jgi:hypothetical protein